MALQLRRGLKINLPMEAAAGEPLIATDTKELYIGAGTGQPVYKVSDLIFSDVTPAVVEGKIWLDTTTNKLYRVDAGSWVPVGGTELATAVDLGGLGASDTIAPSQKAVKTYVDNAVSNVKIPREWPDSVISIVTDAPATPTAGDRYLVGVGVGAFIGQDNNIAEYDGTTWAYTIPTKGSFISVDDDTTGLYYFGGVSWVKKSFELNSAGAGIKITNGEITLADGIAPVEGGLVWDPVLGTLSVGIIDGGTF